MKCVNCNATIPARGKYCSECGTPAPIVTPKEKAIDWVSISATPSAFGVFVAGKTLTFTPVKGKRAGIPQEVVKNGAGWVRQRELNGTLERLCCHLPFPNAGDWSSFTGGVTIDASDIPGFAQSVANWLGAVLDLTDMNADQRAKVVEAMMPAKPTSETA
jgi:hypothetical protein